MILAKKDPATTYVEKHYLTKEQSASFEAAENIGQERDWIGKFLLGLFDAEAQAKQIADAHERQKAVDAIRAQAKERGGEFNSYYHSTNGQEKPSKENYLPLTSRLPGGRVVDNDAPANVQVLKLEFEFGSEEEKAKFVSKQAKRKADAEAKAKASKNDAIKAQIAALQAELGEEAVTLSESKGGVPAKPKGKGK